jgi:hypothetical protein
MAEMVVYSVPILGFLKLHLVFSNLKGTQLHLVTGIIKSDFV